jgi:hypothetical protein
VIVDTAAVLAAVLPTMVIVPAKVEAFWVPVLLAKAAIGIARIAISASNTPKIKILFFTLKTSSINSLKFLDRISITPMLYVRTPFSRSQELLIGSFSTLCRQAKYYV